MSLRADFASRALIKFVTGGKQPPTGAPASSKSKYTDDERVARATKLREHMHSLLDKGEKPTGPKADWVRESAGHVIQLLGEIAEGYNAEHDDDAALTGDMLDILATVRGTLIDDE